MMKTKRLNTTIVLWTLIPLTFVVVACAVSDLFCLGTMVARAEKQALEGHFKNLSMLVVADSRPSVGLAGDGMRLVDFETGEPARVLPRLGLAAMTPSPSFEQFATTGGAYAGVLRHVVLGSTGGDVVSGLVPAAADHSGLSGREILEDFKRETGAEAALFVVRSGQVAPLATTVPTAAWLSEDEIRTVADGGTILREHRLGDSHAAILAKSVHDFGGRRVGVAVVAHDRAAFTASVEIVRKVLLGIGLLLLFVVASVACAMSAETPSGEPLRA